MYKTWSRQNWFENNNSASRNTIAFILSVLVVIFLLLIPVSRNYQFNDQSPTIQIELTQAKTPVIQPQKSQDEPTRESAKPQLKEKLVQPIKKEPAKVKPIDPIEAKSKEVINEDSIKAKPKEKPLPNTSVLLNTFSNRGLYRQLDKDFQASTGKEEDFKFKKVQPHEMYQVVKIINEEVDKPEYEMDFYSLGVVGSVERLFDKISYEKKFTTKYGTKIACKGVGPLIMCGWK
jgi:outer membrane biosynthesis protein TonB